MVELVIMVIGKLINYVETKDKEGNTKFRKISKDGSITYIDDFPIERDYRSIEEEIRSEWNEEVVRYYTPAEYHKKFSN